MKSDNTLLAKTFFGLLLVGMSEALADVSCQVIDSVITGRFLGTAAFTALGLFYPVILFFDLLGGLLGLGVGVICTRYMGMVKPKRVNQVFSIVMIALLAAGILFTLGIITGTPVIAQTLGGKTGNPEIVAALRDYIRGYAVGLIPMYFNIALMSLMMVDNDQKRSLAAMGVILAADIALDLLNVLVIHKGMFGMALATSISYIAEFIILLGHFTKKDRVLHFTMEGLKISDLFEVITIGITSAINSGSQALTAFVYNILLLSIAGAGAVASFALSSYIIDVMYVIVVGIKSSTSTLCSLLYGQEDRRGLIAGFSLSMRTIVILFTVAAGILILFARPLAGLFLPPDSESELHQAAIFIRLVAVQLWLMAPNFSLGGAYQGIKRLKLNYMVTLMREAVFPIVSVYVFGKACGMKGFEAGLVAAGFLVLVSTFAIPAIINKRISLAPEELLLLPDDFGAKPEDVYEVSMHTLDDVMTASEEIMDFVQKKDGDKRTAFMLSLFAEEMPKNTIQYGFKEGKTGSVDLRLVYNEKGKVIWLRDNGKPFDPIDWLKKNSNEDTASGMGIRMVTAMAKDVSYIPSMELNNLVIVL